MWRACRRYILTSLTLFAWSVQECFSLPDGTRMCGRQPLLRSHQPTSRSPLRHTVHRYRRIDTAELELRSLRQLYMSFDRLRADRRVTGCRHTVHRGSPRTAHPRCTHSSSTHRRRTASRQQGLGSPRACRRRGRTPCHRHREDRRTGTPRRRRNRRMSSGRSLSLGTRPRRIRRGRGCPPGSPPLPRRSPCT